MIFFLSWGKDASKNYGTAMVKACSNCNMERGWSLFVKRKRGIIMFIPFWYDHRYFLICNECNNYIELYGEQIKQYKKNNKAFINYRNKKITKEELAKIINSNNHILEIKEPDITWECPSCKGINPNTTYKCKHCGDKLI